MIDVDSKIGSLNCDNYIFFYFHPYNINISFKFLI